MANTFSSRLIFANDIPVRNASITALDRHPNEAGAVDLTVNSSPSDQSGRFTITYEKPEGFGKKVYLLFRYTARDHPYSASRAVRRNLKEIRLPEFEWLEFKPSVHGFQFVNNFPPFDLPDNLPKIPNLPIVSKNFGLCGGMSSAAYDYYLAGRSPQDKQTPEQGSDLHDFLLKRQVNTFGFLAENLLKVAKWTRLPNKEANGTHRQTRLEWDAVKRELDAEKALVLTLIYMDASSAKELLTEIWENHQVLAYGYTPRSDGMLDIHIYDSNFPGRDDAIVQAKRVLLNTDQGLLEGLECQEIIPGRKTIPVRGFFPMDYEREDPPGV